MVWPKRQIKNKYIYVPILLFLLSVKGNFMKQKGMIH